MDTAINRRHKAGKEESFGWSWQVQLPASCHPGWQLSPGFITGSFPPKRSSDNNVHYILVRNPENQHTRCIIQIEIIGQQDRCKQGGWGGKGAQLTICWPQAVPVVTQDHHLLVIRSFGLTSHILGARYLGRYLRRYLGRYLGTNKPLKTRRIEVASQCDNHTTLSDIALDHHHLVIGSFVPTSLNLSPRYQVINCKPSG